jgi:hypothetical protein
MYVSGPPPGHDQPHPPPPQPRSGEPIIPKLKGTPQIVGLVGDPGLNRDSGGSCRFGDRLFWTYRDTQLFQADGSPQTLPIITSTASWSDLSPSGGPQLQNQGGDPLKTIVHHQYGDNHISRLESAYFPIHTHGTGRIAGNREDGSRHPFWPDSPPLVIPNSSPITAYTFIKIDHIKGLEGLVEHPPTTLYRITQPSSTSDRSTLPTAQIVAPHFWKEGEIPYGVYGNLLWEGYAYLYAQVGDITALARVPAPAIEDRSAYTYFVNNSWTPHLPNRDTPGLNIEHSNAAGQGTYFFHQPWDSFVWIGGCKFPGAAMFVCTARNPEGPWREHGVFWEGVGGSAGLPAYSIQAHPGMAREGENNVVWVSYTKTDEVYSTPLVRVEWE